MPQMNGETVVFPILGDPIAQVLAPRALSDIFEQRGVNAVVVPWHVATADFADAMAQLKRVRNVPGIVITIPHKTAALDACDRVSERAAFVGSVNVMRKTQDGGLIGDNVDGLGYLEGLRAAGFDAIGKTALLIGAGGAGSAVALELLVRGLSRLAIHDIDTERRDRLIARLNERFPLAAKVGSRSPAGYDLIANVTPVGMRDTDPYPVDAERLMPGQFVADAITKPEVTPLIAFARRLGCNTMTGVGMFNGEAQTLADLLTGQR